VDAFSGFRGRPGEYQGQERKTINSFGFISTPEIRFIKPENTIRVVFMGGSATAGTGFDLSDRNTWPWLVWKILQKNVRGKRVEFINGALGGYTSFESYGRFWSRIRFFSPDIIVLCHGWNEMYYFNKDKVDDMISWRMLSDGSWTLDRSDEAVAIYEPMLIDHLLRPSQALIRLRLRFSKPGGGYMGELGSSAKAFDRYDRRGLEIWRTNLGLFRESAKFLGVKLFVAKQPTLMVPGLPREERLRCRIDFHGFGYEEHLDAFEQIYRVIDEEIAKDDIIDLTELSGRPQYFYDHVHPTREGVSAIAEIVYRHLLEYLNPQKKAEEIP